MVVTEVDPQEQRRRPALPGRRDHGDQTPAGQTIDACSRADAAGDKPVCTYFTSRPGVYLTAVSYSVPSSIVKRPRSPAGLLLMVGTTRFELATSRTPSERATRLRYVPEIRSFRLDLD